MGDSDQKTAGPITRALEGMRHGEPGAADEACRLLYDELHRIARLQMRGRTAGGTLQPTALVHETYLRISAGSTEFQDRQHYLATAARAMRGILVDFARRRGSLKRGGGRARITLDEALQGGVDPVAEILAVNEALDLLARVDERQAQVVELRYFAGLSVPETAEAMGVSERKVQRLWSMARAWLLRFMSQRDASFRR
ncbi:MAG: ECF-type sigma factor [Planctomycetota bacterium]